MKTTIGQRPVLKACTTTWNVLKKKEVLSNRHQTGWPWKTTAVDDRNSQWHHKQSPQGRGEGISINRLKKHQYRGYTTRCKPLIGSNATSMEQLFQFKLILCAWSYYSFIVQYYVWFCQCFGYSSSETVCALWYSWLKQIPWISRSNNSPAVGKLGEYWLTYDFCSVWNIFDANNSQYVTDTAVIGKTITLDNCLCVYAGPLNLNHLKVVPVYTFILFIFLNVLTLFNSNLPMCQWKKYLGDKNNSCIVPIYKEHIKHKPVPGSIQMYCIYSTLHYYWHPW